MNELEAMVAALLPLPVSRVLVNDSFFTLVGPAWNLSVNTDWTIAQSGSIIASWDDSGAESSLQSLVGQNLVAAAFPNDLVDPRFFFDSGLSIEIRSETDLDPWVMHVEGLPYVLVGLQDPRSAGPDAQT